MADEELGEYMLVLEDGSQQPTSRDFTGKATATYPNGEIYEGQFVEGIRQGKGKYSFSNGDVYEGDFVNNQQHGIGKCVYNEKGEYHGYFQNGKRHGEGVFKYPNGDIYSGQWKEGKKEGRGTYVSQQFRPPEGATNIPYNVIKESQVKIRGTWAEGKVIKGQWIFPNGTYFEGTFDNNRPKGEGTWIFENGNTCSGVYTQTLRPGEDLENPIISLAWNTRS